MYFLGWSHVLFGVESCTFWGGVMYFLGWYYACIRWYKSIYISL